MKKILLAIISCLPLFAHAQLADSTARLVHVQGALNFRDIGGYKTKDGKTVKWNKVYRSADVSRLTAADLDTLRRRHIRNVVDFRGVKESEAAPDHLPAGTAYLLLPAGSDSLPNAQQMQAAMQRGNSWLLDFYGNPQYLGPRYKAFFSMLLTMPQQEALMYHCTGGRDRTGMATALLLYILGVPMETINADFTASNIYLQPMYGRMFQQMSAAQMEKMKQALELRPELLTAMFNGIKQQYGTVEQFMQVELGIGPKQVAQLKTMYLN